MNHGQELAGIDFSAMIGSPLNAAIEAQTKSALTTIRFIKEVGFKADVDDGAGNVTPGDPIYIDFHYDKINPALIPDANGVFPAGIAPTIKYKLSVPVLSVVPIPYIRIENISIDFNAKIASVEYEKNKTAESYGGSVSAKAGWGWGSAKLSAYYSKRKSNISGSTVNRTYSLGVKVVAVQDEIPAGLDRVLGILEDAIKETPA